MGDPCDEGESLSPSSHGSPILSLVLVNLSPSSEDGDPCDEGERLTRRGVETISDEGEDGRPM